VLAAALILGAAHATPIGDDDGGTTVIRFSYWGNIADDAIFREVAESFEKSHPKVRIKFEWVVGDYGMKLPLLLVSQTAADQVPRDEAQELRKTNPELLKKTRYIWLKNPENLTDKQRARLGHLEQLNLRSNRAYLLKESFREFWDYDSKDGARRFLKKWFWWATHSRLKPMRDFAWTMKNHLDDLLNYFEMRIDNRAVEGMNNKAKVVSHRCYGFRTAPHYITALYHCLGDLPEPKLVHKFL